MLTTENIESIMQLFANKQEVMHQCTMVNNQTIAQNNYNLSVSTYVEPISTKETINIYEINQQINQTVERIASLRQSINKIIKEIEA